MITVPPLTALMIVLIKVNGYFGQLIRYRIGQTTTWQNVMLVVIWLWFVLLSLPGLAAFLTGR